ncbi:MAG: type IV pilus twitching motility protein PilT, partial [Alphaproteobacteria bacterium]
TEDFAEALRAAMRQDPDIILVGEMRDLETITTALMAAETGHLVLSTLHTTDVMETINRVLSFYSAHQQDQIRHQLAAVLKAIVSQRLVARADKQGRVPAVEVLVTNARVRECIRDMKKTSDIPDLMKQSFTTYGMQSFDMSLLGLVQKKLVTVDEAMEQATNPGDFALRLKGVSGADEATYAEYKEDEDKKKEGGGGGKQGQGGAGFDNLLERFSE